MIKLSFGNWSRLVYLGNWNGFLLKLLRDFCGFITKRNDFIKLSLLMLIVIRYLKSLRTYNKCCGIVADFKYLVEIPCNGTLSLWDSAFLMHTIATLFLRQQLVVKIND